MPTRASIDGHSRVANGSMCAGGRRAPTAGSGGI
jgi:hypothetical protein